MIISFLLVDVTEQRRQCSTLPMAPKVRIQYPGATYHVMNRGDHRAAIFRDDQDRERFLSTLEEG